MSYSRWGNSDWYTYADASGGFTVCGVLNNIPIEDIRNDIDAVLQQVVVACGDEKAWAPQIVTPAMLEELRDYMLQYLDDYPEAADTPEHGTQRREP